ncbi:family 2 encapsulin nanocompartment cargo protein polyprenyl transferase [Kibdelosporangium lantanae]
MTAGTLPRAIGRVRELLPAALADALARLGPDLQEVCGYQLGTHAGGAATGTASGKLVRPAMTLLCAEAAGGDPAKALPGAVAVELIHAASLIHDDIMDGDRERRHQPTVWVRYGVPMAILAGDALLALAFEVLAAQGSSVATHELARQLRALAIGQGHDLRFERITTPDAYLRMVEGKTGALIGCACQLGTLAVAAPAPVVAAFEEFGSAIGVAFQLVDDLLGIWGATAVTGKPVGSDLRSRKRTGPVVAALAGDCPAAAELSASYGQPVADVRRLATLVEQAGGRAWARAEARRRVARAWAGLDTVQVPEAARTDLAELTRFVVARDW